MPSLQARCAHLSRQVNSVSVMPLGCRAMLGQWRHMVVAFMVATVVDAAVSVAASMFMRNPAKTTKMNVETCILIASVIAPGRSMRMRRQSQLNRQVDRNQQN